MNYYEYIKSKEWKTFRKEILSKRTQCQRCCSKIGLQLHHKHYKTLGNEKSSDIIVLCKECHFGFHKKKKWLKVKKLGGIMDFTRASKPDRFIYNVSEIIRTCKRCGENHPVFYRIFKNGRKVLAMACPNSKPRIAFITYEELDIPVLDRKKGIIA